MFSLFSRTSFSPLAFGRLDTIAATLLGTIEGPVRSLDELDGILAPLMLANADTHRDPIGTTFERTKRFNRSTNSFCDDRGSVEGRARKHEHELLASPASSEIDATDAGGKDVGNAPNDLVTYVVTEPVVDRLEVVDVAHDSR